MKKYNKKQSNLYKCNLDEMKKANPRTKGFWTGGSLSWVWMDESQGRHPLQQIRYAKCV